MTTDTTPTTATTPEIIKGELMLALTKDGLAYQTLLQQSEDVVFTKDNLNEERTALINLRKVKKRLEDEVNPWTEKWAAWNRARKSLLDPVAEVLNKKTNEYKKLAQEVADEAQKAEAERLRVSTIKLQIDTFFIEQSQNIAAATTTQELVLIEKLIGSHKSAARYMEFAPLMAAKASILADLIKKQKESLKQLDRLKTAENAANAIGDDQAVLDSREAQEAVTAQIEEKRVTVQEQALGMAVNSDVVEAEVVLPTAPKPRRTTVKWKIIDDRAAIRCGYAYQTVLPDLDKIEAYVKSVDKKGISDDGFIQFGIKIYLEKTY